MRRKHNPTIKGNTLLLVGGVLVAGFFAYEKGWLGGILKPAPTDKAGCDAAGGMWLKSISTGQYSCIFPPAPGPKITQDQAIAIAKASAEQWAGGGVTFQSVNVTSWGEFDVTFSMPRQPGVNYNPAIPPGPIPLLIKVSATGQVLPGD